MTMEYKILRKYLMLSDIITSRFEDTQYVINELLVRDIVDGYVFLTRPEARYLFYNTKLSDHLVRINFDCVLRYKDRSGIHIKIFNSTEDMDNFIESHKCQCGCDECPCFEVITEYINRDLDSN